MEKVHRKECSIKIVKRLRNYLALFPRRHYCVFNSEFPRFGKFVTMLNFLGQVRVSGPDKCWEWVGAKNKDNYGYFHCSRIKLGSGMAHVAAYILFVGKIPKRNGKKQLCVCHSCDNPSCVNPNHLWLGTKRDNSLDSIDKGRYKGGFGTGRDNPRVCDLTDSEVRKVRKLYIRGVKSGERYHGVKKIAKRFNISRDMVREIGTYQGWTSVIQ